MEEWLGEPGQLKGTRNSLVSCPPKTYFELFLPRLLSSKMHSWPPALQRCGKRERFSVMIMGFSRAWSEEDSPCMEVRPRRSTAF